MLFHLENRSWCSVAVLGETCRWAWLHFKTSSFVKLTEQQQQNQVLVHLHITHFPSVACYWSLVCWTIKQDACQPKYVLVTAYCIVWLHTDATSHKVFWTGILSIVHAAFSLNYFSLLSMLTESFLAAFWCLCWRV